MSHVPHTWAYGAYTMCSDLDDVDDVIDVTHARRPHSLTRVADDVRLELPRRVRAETIADVIPHALARVSPRAPRRARARGPIRWHPKSDRRQQGGARGARKREARVAAGGSTAADRAGDYACDVWFR